MTRATRRPALGRFAATLIAIAALAACGGGGGNGDTPNPPAPAPQPQPLSVKLEKIGGYATGQFGVSAAEIPAYDATTQRLFVVNALAGKVDVLDLRVPANPVKIGEIDASGVLAGAEINVEEVENIIYHGAQATLARIHLDGVPTNGALDRIRRGNQDIISVELSEI